MGRPSVRTERREQILAATARCVARVGLSGLTLEKVSAESGMSRGHVRHYVGNREDLVLALVEWELGRDEIVSASKLAETNDIDTMLDYLFGPPFSAPGDENAVILELLNASRTNDPIRRAMLDGYTGLRRQIHVILIDAYPSSTSARLWDCAYALLALAIGNAAMSDLERSTGFDSIVRAAAVQILAEFSAPSRG